MIFDKLVVENFRVFYGKQIIPLFDSSDKKNLILFGGLNGSGKTSLLNAFNLLLFGGNLIPKSEYRTLLGSALNNKHFVEGGNQANLGLYIRGKESFSIHLKLYFDRYQQYTHDERSIIFKNRLVQMTDHEFRKFIERRIPSEIAPFFIFDGEKIQQLVERQENGELKKAIQNVISLDLYKSALGHVREAHKRITSEAEKFVSSGKVNNARIELENAETETKKIQTRIQEYKGQIKKLEEKRESTRKLMQEKLKSISGSRVEYTEKIAIRKKELLETIKLIDEFKSEVPLYMVKGMVENLKKRILLEQKKIKIERQQQVQFQSFDLFIKDLLQQLEHTQISQNVRDQLANLARKSWANVHSIQVEQSPSVEVIHANDLSQNDMVRLVNYKFTEEHSIKSLLDCKYRLEEEIEQLINDQENAPEALDVTKEEKEIDRVSAAIGEKEARKRSLMIRLKKNEDEVSRLRRTYNQFVERASKSNDLRQRLTYSNKIVDLMEKFVERVTVSKAQQISDEFSKIISAIFRKKYEFHSIEFDPVEYKIKIKNEHGNLVSLANRSAGEKQLIALALIWSLTKCANVSLPFIIDTPLGRLDSVHRENLAKFYFPDLSKQVVILSTDTEVHDQFLDPLKDNILKQYHLDYNQEDKVTIIREGYF